MLSPFLRGVLETEEVHTGRMPRAEMQKLQAQPDLA